MGDFWGIAEGVRKGDLAQRILRFVTCFNNTATVKYETKIRKKLGVSWEGLWRWRNKNPTFIEQI